MVLGNTSDICVFRMIEIVGNIILHKGEIVIELSCEYGSICE